MKIKVLRFKYEKWWYNKTGSRLMKNWRVLKAEMEVTESTGGTWIA